MENKNENVTTISEKTGKKGSKSLAVFGIVALVLVALFGLFMVMKGNYQQPQVQGETSAATTSNVKEFTVSGTNYKFDPSTITVNKGDTVKITFKDDDGTHNLTVDGYNVSTQTISSGQDTITFVADKTGSFEYYCSVGKHRQLGMTGTLVVQ